MSNVEMMFGVSAFSALLTLTSLLQQGTTVNFCLFIIFKFQTVLEKFLPLWNAIQLLFFMLQFLLWCKQLVRNDSKYVSGFLWRLFSNKLNIFKILNENNQVNISQKFQNLSFIRKTVFFYFGSVFEKANTNQGLVVF